MNLADQERQPLPTGDEQEPDCRFTLANERSSERPKSPSALSTSRPMALNAPVGRRLPQHQYGTTLTDTKAIQGVMTASTTDKTSARRVS